MNFSEFLTHEQIEDAPEDKPMAFAYLARIAQSSLRDATSERDETDDWDREFILDARIGFMNTVLILGRSYGIEPFASMQMPRYDKFDYSTHKQFKFDLDHYLGQLMVGNAIRTRRDSVAITADVKSRIRAHVHHIKEHIDKADMSDAKRASLHNKLALFESALEKDRVNVMLVGGMLIGLLSASANVATLADSSSFHKLISNVMKDVGEAKAADDENRKLPPFDPPVVLLPPRREPEATSPREAMTPREDFSADLDDEIPF